MTGWFNHAECLTADPDIFYPDKSESTAPAKRICAQCPVTTQCLNHALDHNERYGVWGGLSPRERANVALVQRRHGTQAANELVEQLHAKPETVNPTGDIDPETAAEIADTGGRLTTARAAELDVCVHGHDLTNPDNVYGNGRYPDGRPRTTCRVCVNARRNGTLPCGHPDVDSNRWRDWRGDPTCRACTTRKTSAA